MRLLDFDRAFGDYIGKDQTGDVGVEIELEAFGKKFFPPNPCNNWKSTNDNSLRGIACEYVMKKPVPIDKVGTQIKELEKTILDSGVDIHCSFRAGTHVHVNCLELTPKQIVNFAALYYSFENVLTNWCGPDRIGNFFCLRVDDAPAVLLEVAEVFTNKQGNLQKLNDEIRYAALNWIALQKYGSLEFRAMSSGDFDKTIEWVKILHRLREKSKEFGSIEAILEQFSMANPRNFAKDILGVDFYLQIKDQPNFEMEVLSGIRNAQDFLIFMR